MNATPMTLQEVLKAAPSVAAITKHESRTDRFTVVPTIDILSELNREGFGVFSAREQRVRLDSRRGFQMHELRLRPTNTGLLSVDQLICEAVVRNAADGSAAFNMVMGLFRCVCSNQMTVSTGQNWLALHIRHTGDIVRQIIGGIRDILAQGPKVMSLMDDMKRCSLSLDEQHAYASAAKQLRWENPESVPFTTEAILAPHRREDVGDSLYLVGQRVQENLTRPRMLRARVEDPSVRYGIRRVSSRGVTGITQDAKLQAGLFRLQEEMLKLKQGVN